MPPEQQFVNSVQSQPVTPPFATPQQSVPQIGYAGFWLRYLAAIFDGVIMNIVSFLLGLALGFVWATAVPEAKNSIILPIISGVLGVLLYWGYFIYFTNKQQATIGKKLLGLRVVAEDGSRLSLGKIIFRETIGKIISMVILGIGFFMVAFTAKKQGLHDKMAGSVVLSNRAERKTWAFVLSIIFASILPIIAIIGILASVVLASLNVARMKGFDASVKANMSLAHTQAELTYDMNNNSYATVCVDPQIVNFFTRAETVAKTKVLCNATTTAYAAYLPLKSPTETNTGWCIDSTGVSGESVALWNATVCPNASSDLLGL